MFGRTVILYKTRQQLPSSYFTTLKEKSCQILGIILKKFSMSSYEGSELTSAHFPCTEERKETVRSTTQPLMHQYTWFLIKLILI